MKSPRGTYNGYPQPAPGRGRDWVLETPEANLPEPAVPVPGSIAAGVAARLLPIDRFHAREWFPHSCANLLHCAAKLIDQPAPPAFGGHPLPYPCISGDLKKDLTGGIEATVHIEVIGQGAEGCEVQVTTEVPAGNLRAERARKAAAVVLVALRQADEKAAS